MTHTRHIDYTRAQTMTLQYIVYFSAPLSVLGSSLIIYVILKERKTLHKSTYHRILLGMSTLDWLCSLSMLVFGPWAMPAEADYVIHARGTFSTCAVAAFFLNFFFGTMFYAGTLALYFLLVIRFGKSEKWVARYIEPFGHLLAIGQTIASGTVGVVYKTFNPVPEMPGWCWHDTFPSKCTTIKTHDACIRGGHMPMWYNVLITGPWFYATVFGIMLVSMVLITLKVRDTEKRIQRYAGQRDRNYVRTREVAIQGLIYIASMFLVYSPVASLQMAGDSPRINFAFAFLMKTLSAMQGFFNALIFLRNRYRALTAQGQSLHFLRRFLPRSRSLVDHANDDEPTTGEMKVTPAVPCRAKQAKTEKTPSEQCIEDTNDSTEGHGVDFLDECRQKQLGNGCTHATPERFRLFSIEKR